MNIISIHIFPHEINEYKRVILQLEKNLNHLKNEKSSIEVWVTLNNNISILDEVYENQFLHITNLFLSVNKHANINVKSVINDTNTFYGVNEHRRSTIQRAKESDFIFFLDCDIYFSELTLKFHLETINKIKNDSKYFILSPQTVRLWDTSWDCLVNENYLRQPINSYLNLNPEQFEKIKPSNIELVKNDKFKWAGGWFNCYSAHLLKLIGIPRSFKGYGPDDTFAMYCCQYMKSKNINVNQYILKNLIVYEHTKLKSKKNFFKKDIPNFRSECSKYMQRELVKFYKKL